ncbi:MAG: PadR family transcriptional regulator [Actinomycetota bacterium]
MHRHRGYAQPRARWRTGRGWVVRARVERFVEPAVLLLLREGPRHGYELLDSIPQLAGEAGVDIGNLYRMLRALEAEGLVSSEWSADLPGPAKRTYRLTDAGKRLLTRWAGALREVDDGITRFLNRYDETERG